MPVRITIKATTMEGTPAADPSVRVDVTQTSPSQRAIAQVSLADFQGEATIEIPDTDEFPLWQVTVWFSRFDAGAASVFMPRGNPSPTFELSVTRMPRAWKPQFVPLHSLNPTRFQKLLDVIAVSTDVDLKMGPPVGDLSTKYDTLTEPAQVLGKMALLNLFAVLSDETDLISGDAWVKSLKKIVRLDQERFVAEIDSELFETVEMILGGLNGAYKNQGFFTEPESGLQLHVPNIPPQYGAENIQKMLTVKKDYEQGNVQLTVTYLIVNGKAVHLLDCDMDEDRNLLKHGLDVIKHAFNGGTSPVTMHEYIVKDSAQQSGGKAAVDLGYTLV